MHVFTEELFKLYSAHIKGKESPLERLAIQYRDYAHWQKKWLQGDRLKKQLEYWKTHLKDAPPLLNLPKDNNRPTIQRYQGKKRYFVIPRSLTESIKALSQQENTTLFMLLFAVFNVLLSRYTNQEDIVVGTPIANRNHTEIEPLIGFFVNTLALRTDLSKNPSFKELLGRVKSIALSAYANQDLPFEKLVEEIQPEREMSYHPIFQVMFVLQNTAKEITKMQGIDLELIDIDAGTSHFDVTLELEETVNGLKGAFEYNIDLFEEATIDRMIGHYQTLLGGIVQRPEEGIQNLPLLTIAEKQQILVEWNSTKEEYVDNKCINLQFEQQVEKTPEAIAIVYGNKKLSYQELNHKANQLAHYLQKNNVGVETLVAICMERSIELVIGLLGILKAGGAYVPLDSEFPKNRLLQILNDSGVNIVLTNSILINTLPKGGYKTLFLDLEVWSLASRKTSNPIHTSKKEDAAYVIYTSGSTGVPKGVINEHEGIVNRLVWMQETFKLSGDDVVLQKTPYSFDVSVWEFFWPLMFGAKLVLAKPHGHKDPHYLADLINQEKVTTLHFVPSMLQLFLEIEEVGKCKSIKRVICSGEALSHELKERFYQRLNTELHNLYGPTEAAIDVSHWDCSEQLPQKIIPIGRSISNIQLYILDKEMQLVPRGVTGEIYIGGVGVARGYLNRPELTSEKFVTDPFSKSKKKRLYKTGDQGRYLSNGAIEYLGRIDHQVKIRGFRIELGEIESAIQSYSHVKEAVVVTHEEKAGDARIAAYYVAEENQEIILEELREYLKNKIPSYMVPSSFTALDSMPLTPNGKSDRKTLPTPDVGKQNDSVAFIPPETKTEIAIAEIWKEVLGTEKISSNDNFFDLGGHSLLLIKVHKAIQEKRTKAVSIVDMFQYPTINSLSNHFNQKMESNKSLDKIQKQAMLRKMALKKQVMKHRRRDQ